MLGKPIDANSELAKTIRRRQESLFRKQYPDYDPSRHDEFLLRYNLEGWQRSKDAGEEIPKYVEDMLQEARRGAKKANL